MSASADPLDLPVEDLDPVLARTVIQGTVLGPMVKHPFVNQPALPMPTRSGVPSFAWLNRSLRLKTEAYEAAVAAGDWNRAVALVERPWRLDYLGALAPRIADEDLADMLPGWWADTEDEAGNAATMLRLLARTGFVTDADPLPDEFREDALVIFRGEGAWDGRLADGTAIAWSLSRETAAWFAERGSPEGQRGTVLRAIVLRENVLAFITARGESEVIVAPGSQVEVEVIE
jgi:hypothetical protein